MAKNFVVKDSLVCNSGKKKAVYYSLLLFTSLSSASDMLILLVKYLSLTGSVQLYKGT